MRKPEFKNHYLLCLLMALLLAASPVAATLFCACAEMTEQAAVSDKDCCPPQPDENHCPPAANASVPDLSHRPGAEVAGQTTARQNDCQCAKNVPHNLVLTATKGAAEQNFQAAVLPARSYPSIVRRVEHFEFFTPRVFYPPRSALLSDVPARAPPIL